MTDQALARMTALEFLELPEAITPNELINGEVIVSPAPQLTHQDAVLRFGLLLNDVGQGGKVYVAPVDVYLDDLNVVQPDLPWLAEGSACVPVEDRYLRGAPDLVIEVFSPGSVRRDRRDKFQLYQRFGVREYWMADPAERYIEVYRRENDRFVRQGVYGPEDSFVSSVLGGMTIEVKAIFPA